MHNAGEVGLIGRCRVGDPCRSDVVRLSRYHQEIFETESPRMIISSGLPSFLGFYRVFAIMVD